MSVTDMRVTCQIKAILTRHWIDQRELNVSVHGGSVRLRGEMRRLASHRHGSFDISWLTEVVAQVRRVPGVKKVYFLDVKLEDPEDDYSVMDEAESDVTPYLREHQEELDARTNKPGTSHPHTRR